MSIIIKRNQIVDFFDDAASASPTVSWSSAHTLASFNDALAAHNISDQAHPEFQADIDAFIAGLGKDPDVTSIAVSGKNLVVVNTTNQYFITNFEAFSTYSVESVSGGTLASNVSSAGMFSLTANGVTGVMYFRINRDNGKLVKTYAVAKGTASLGTPYVADITDTSNTGTTPIIYGSAINPIGISDVLSASQFQVSSDPTFASGVLDSGSISGSTNSWQITPALSPNVQYYTRVRHKGTTLNYWSQWSQPASIKLISGVGSVSYSVSGISSKIIGRGAQASTQNIVSGYNVSITSYAQHDGSGTWTGSGTTPPAPYNIIGSTIGSFAAAGASLYMNASGTSGTVTINVLENVPTMTMFSSSFNVSISSGSAYLANGTTVSTPSGYVMALNAGITWYFNQSNPGTPLYSTSYITGSNASISSATYTRTYSGNSSAGYPTEAISPLLDTSSSKAFDVTAPADTFVLIFSTQ